MVELARLAPVMTEAEIQAEVRAHAERNRVLVNQLLEMGIDIADRREIDLHFLAPSQRSAEALVETLRRLGHEPRLDKRRLFSRHRSVTINTHLSVNEVIDPQHVEKLVRAATEAGATHDGWGMPVEASG